MNRWTDIAAKALSVVLYPLFVPTYGMVLFCLAFARQMHVLPAVWFAVAIIGTFVLTCVLPVTAIWILIRQGRVTDLQIADAGQRSMPFVYTIMGFGFWCYLMLAVLHAPRFIGLVSIGATIAIILVALINRRWKISAHLTGMGGLVGGMMSYYMGIGAVPSYGTLALWLGLSLALMYARVYLNAHTPAQVCAGWLLGIACTFLPFYLYGA